AYTLKEILTVKSDDVVGCVKTYEAIVKGFNVPKPGVPESFKVLIKELQSLGLDVSVLDENKLEIDLKQDYDDEETGLAADVRADAFSYKNDAAAASGFGLEGEGGGGISFDDDDDDDDEFDDDENTEGDEDGEEEDIDKYLFPNKEVIDDDYTEDDEEDKEEDF
ncbi:MAG: DNA-directed RNA polymerase subunit beta, partial [Oscillospiraceae bacterium]|nr:DNA-directed RNA polymerase subunit beta [Oscillospiraceae bacterium]